MKMTLLFVCLVLLSKTAVAVADGATSNAASIHIQTAGILYKGLPFFVAVEVTNGGDAEVAIPQWNAIGVHIPLNAHFQSVTGEVFSSSVHRYAFIRGEKNTNQGPLPIPRKTWRLSKGEAIRSVANMGPSLEELEMPSGKYRMTIRVWSSPGITIGESEPIEIIVAERTPLSLAGLTNDPVLTVRGTIDMKKSPLVKDLKVLDPRALRETIGFVSLLREIQERPDISSLPVQDYRELVGEWLQPELEQIEFEVLLARREKDKAVLAKEAVLKRSPTMKYWTDEAERGQGFCQTIRRTK